MSEYLSLMMGFNSLLIIAIGYYVLSACAGSRRLLPLPRFYPALERGTGSDLRDADCLIKRMLC